MNLKILAVAQYSPSYGRSSSSRGREDMRDRSYFGRGRAIRFCTHCGRTNHTIDTKKQGRSHVFGGSTLM